MNEIKTKKRVCYEYEMPDAMYETAILTKRGLWLTVFECEERVRAKGDGHEKYARRDTQTAITC